MLERIASGNAVATYSRTYNEVMLKEYFDNFMSEFPNLAYVNEKGMEEFKLINGKKLGRPF